MVVEHHHMHRLAVESTTLAFVSYDPDGAWLELVFRNGAIYRFFNVPPECFEQLLASESKGAYFNHHIRNRFRFQRLPRRRWNQAHQTK
jgi:hypothetical protein